MAMAKLWRLLSHGLRWQRDVWRSSYDGTIAGFVALVDLVDKPLAVLCDDERKRLRLLGARYLQHRFDVLGSGWRRWSRSATVGVNRANRQSSASLAAELPADYVAIDWHADMRADFRFPAMHWSRFIQPGPAPGVDIKVPWELARMHHLVQLALLAVDDATDPALAWRCVQEVDNQIRDFVAANPPRFGVNWRVAMDVAIRAANWVLAVSILDAHGRDTDNVQGILGSTLRDHGRFVVSHLEWHPVVRGNHYLADVCGLAFIAAALPSDRESDAWLALATGEVIAEAQRQINPDGSGFEGSTSYHRLSLDMLVHTLALLLGLRADRWRTVRHSCSPRGLPVGFVPADIVWEELFDNDGRLRLPQVLAERLWRACAFTEHVCRADGRALLIGDNDSGRFFKPCPRIEFMDADEACQRYPERYVDADNGPDCRECGDDHRHLVSAIHALFGDVDDSIDAKLVQWLAGGRALQVPKAVSPQIALTQESRVPVGANVNRLQIPFTHSVNLVDVRCHSYPGWGLYLCRGDGLLLSFRCGPLGLSGTGNHDHNDQLAITLHFDGRDIIADPGTYRYTADFKERDAYRSVNAHFAPRLNKDGREPGSLDDGVWQLGDQAQARVEIVSERLLQGCHRGYGGVVHRRVELFDDHLSISDWADTGIDLMPLDEQFARLNADGCSMAYCPDYGVRRA